MYGVDLGIVTLDQHKAFDKIDHLYLFSTLQAYGNGKEETLQKKRFLLYICSEIISTPTPPPHLRTMRVPWSLPGERIAPLVVKNKGLGS